MALNFQQRSSVLLRRVLLVTFLVVSVVFVTVYAREGESGPLHTVQGAVSGTFAPLKTLGAAAGSGADTAVEGFGNLTADESTLSGLRESNKELRALLAQGDEYKLEAQRLQQLLELKDTYDINGVGARVIGKPAGAWDQTVTIDKGSADGVDSGLTVMDTAGVIGQVVNATEHTATVRLLTDPQSGAAALVQANRAEGIVRGSLQGLLYLEDIDADAEVNVGDVIVTSGLGGSYTRGLIIGTVVKVDSQQGDATRRVVVSPNGGASSLEEVLVVYDVGTDAGDNTAATQGGSDGGDAS